MKTLLCSIGRLENRYIREFVEYYKTLGFTNIVLYDNNRDGEDRFEDVIGDYIESGFVILKDYRNKTVCQLEAYDSCYKEYGKEYDWIAFFDCDEFLMLPKDGTIEKYLNSTVFNGYDCIKVNWLCFGDSDKLYLEEKSLFERFTKPIELNKNVTYNFPENYHIKSIVRGGLYNLKFPNNPHSCNAKNQCNSIGERVDSATPFVPYTYEKAYLVHFSTKTVEEYCTKMKRGFPDHIVNDELRKAYVETRFFRYNKVTEEKVKIIKDALGIDMSYLLPKKFDGEKRKDVQLFMLCYENRDYGFVDNAVMTPLQCGAANGKDVCELKDNTGDNISSANFLYVENTGIYWIWKNVKDAKYKGQTQYRRRLIGIDDKTDYEKIFEKYDVICAKPYNYPENFSKFIPAKTVRGGYAYSHCLEDLDSLGYIVKSEYPEYADDWFKCIERGENLYYSSGFVLPAEKYDEYCSFLFDVLSKWLAKQNIQRYEDVIVHVVRNLSTGKYVRYKKEKQDPMKLSWEGIQWQLHIFGFFAERLFTLWLEHNIPQERRYEVEYEKMEKERMYI